MAAVAALRAAVGRQRSVHIGDIRSPDDQPAAVALPDGAGIDRGGRGDIRGSGIGLGARPLGIAADQRGTAARHAADVDPRAIEHTDLGAQHLDASAVAAAVGRARVDLAAYLGQARHRIADQLDRALVVPHRSRPYHAGRVDDGFAQAVESAGREHHAAAIRDDHAAVVDEGAGRPRADGVAEWAAIGERERDVAGSRQQYAAPRGADVAGVVDAVGDQRDLATAGDGDRALVGDAGGAAARQGIAARLEIRVAQSQRAGDEAADIDLRAAAEQHAVRIEDEDRTVGVEAAEDAGGFMAGDAIQCDRPRTGLDEVDRFTGLDAEGGPIDGQPGRRLGDGGGGAVLSDAAGTGGHRAAGRRRERGHGGGKGAKQDGAPQRIAHRRARVPGMSGHGRSGDGGAARNEGNAMECGEMSHVPYQAPCGVGGEDIPTLFGNAEKSFSAPRTRFRKPGAGAICEWTLRAGSPDRPGMCNRGALSARRGRMAWPCMSCMRLANRGFLRMNLHRGRSGGCIHTVGPQGCHGPQAVTDDPLPAIPPFRHSAMHQAGVPYADSLAVRVPARAVAGVPAGVGAGTDGAAVNHAPAWPTSDGGRSATGRSATRTHTYSARARPCHRRT